MCTRYERWQEKAKYTANILKEATSKVKTNQIRNEKSFWFPLRKKVKIRLLFLWFFEIFIHILTQTNIHVHTHTQVFKVLYH